MPTVNLSTFFPDSRYTLSATATNALNVLYVYNTNTNSANNGGQCCLWTVPAGVGWAKFELWSGGGDGGGACCCQHASYSGGSGSYARKTIRVVPGQSYTICAAGSTAMPTACQGAGAFTSYACGNSSNAGITYPLCLCAPSGGVGVANCNYWQNQCNCTSYVCGVGSFCGADFCICGMRGGSQAATCGFMSWQSSAEPTYIGGAVRMSIDHCQNFHGCGFGGIAKFPGGGGSSANTNNGGCYCGGWGAGGLVLITYK
jgi:hypothetical protein